MLTFSKFGRYGNLGNQLFQYAALIGLANKYRTSVALPQCSWGNYLENPPQIINLADTPPTLSINEPHYHHSDNFLEDVKEEVQLGITSLTGWLQSEKYWEHNKEEVKKALTFNRFHEYRVMEQYPHVGDGKPVIGISIRRGDYVDNPYYELLPAEYYYLALFEHFPDWQKYNIIIFSDDIPYCKVHFQCMENVWFAENLTPIEQLIMGQYCNHFIIANSTFSWWLAYLSELCYPGLGQPMTIIRPKYLFAGEGLKNDTKDHWPARWIPFDHKEKKLNLKDTTFIIPFSNDSHDRVENIQLIINDIRHHFDTIILIGEQGSWTSLYITNSKIGYINFDKLEKFHRTHMLNQLTAACYHPCIINYDADILTPPLQIYLSVLALRSGTDFCYPYDGRFARVPREQWLPVMQKYKDTGMFRDTIFKGAKPDSAPSVGGVIAYRKDAFIEAGGENEKMISYAPEDQERFYRFNKLGYRVARIPGIVYHIDHKITPNSSTKHQDYQANEDEFTHIKSLTKEQLREYVDTWKYFT